MKTINTCCDLGGCHQSGISCYKHLPESSKSATRNVNSPVCDRGCHFVYNLEWGPQHKATKLPVFPPIGRSDQIFSAILIASSYVLGYHCWPKKLWSSIHGALWSNQRCGGMLNVEDCWKTTAIISSSHMKLIAKGLRVMQISWY